MTFGCPRFRVLWLLPLVAVLLSCSPALARDVALLGVFPDRVLIDMDGQRLVLVVGQDAQQAVRLLSTNTLDRRAWLEIQGQRRELAVGDHSPVVAPGTGPHRESVGVRIQPDASGALTVSGSINGRAVRFRVDTGSETVLLGSSEAQRIGLSPGQGALTTVQTPNGRVFGHRVLLSRVQVGSVAVDEVLAVVVPGDAPRTPVLGMSFLDRVIMYEEGGALLLRRARP